MLGDRGKWDGIEQGANNTSVLLHRYRTAALYCEQDCILAYHTSRVREIGSAAVHQSGSSASAIPDPQQPPISARVNGLATGQMPSALAATQSSTCRHHSQPWCLALQHLEARPCVRVGSVHLSATPAPSYDHGVMDHPILQVDARPLQVDAYWPMPAPSKEVQAYNSGALGCIAYFNSCMAACMTVRLGGITQMRTIVANVIPDRSHLMAMATACTVPRGTHTDEFPHSRHHPAVLRLVPRCQQPASGAGPEDAAVPPGQVNGHGCNVVPH